MKAGVSAVNLINGNLLRQWSRRIKRFAEGIIRKLGNGFKKFNKCSVCKTALMTLIYVTLSQINSSITGLMSHMPELIDLLHKFFDKTITAIREFISEHRSIFSDIYFVYQLDDFVESICTELGWC